MSKALGICHGSFGRALLLDLNRPLVAHAHAQAHLLVKLDGPDTRFRIGEQEFVLGNGSAIHVRPWEPHDFPHGRLPEHALVLALYIEPAWLSQTLASAALPGPLLAMDAGAYPLAHSIARSLVGGRAACGEQVAHELTALLARLGSDTAAQTPPRPVDRRLRKALTLIDEQIGQEVDFAALAGEAGLSRAHFYELFKRDLGLTPAVYLNTHRMARAIEAVEHSQAPLGNVALDLGFSAQSNFTRFFRDIQGVPPHDYRQASRPP